MSLAGVRAVSFDLDGTLYELPALAAAVRRLALARALRAPLATARELRALAGLRRAMEGARRAGGDLGALALPAGLDRPALAALEERWYAAGLARAGPRPGVPALLEALRARGLTLLLVTDHPARAKLAALGLAGAFAAVHEGEALGRLKPDPAGLLAALAGAGLAPEELLHVGDRAETDGLAAARAGVRALIVPPRGPLALGALEARAARGGPGA